MPANTRAALIALCAFGIYATHDAIIKHLGAVYSPIQIIFFSVLMGIPFATLMLLHDKTPDSFRPKRAMWVMLRSAAVIIGMICGFTSFALLPFAQVYAIIFAAPLLVTLLSIPILGERVGWHRAGAVVAGLTGVLVALRPGASALSLGHFTALTAAFAIAFTGVATRKLRGSERSVILLIYPMMATLLPMGAALPYVYKPMPIADLGLMAAVAFMAWLAALLVIRAFNEGEAGVVAPMQYSQFLWALIYGAVFFDEWPDTMTLIGAAMIVGSGIYIIWRETHNASSAQPVTRARPRPETGSRSLSGAFAEETQE